MKHPVYLQDEGGVEEVGRDIGSDDTVVYTPKGSESDEEMEEDRLDEEPEETEEEMRKRESRDERRKMTRERCERYMRRERKLFFEWTERFKNKSSKEALPVEVSPGDYIVDQIFCTGDKKKTEGLYLVGWVHPNPKKSYKPSWQLPEDVPDEEIELYEEQGIITETQYDGLLDYLEDYGLLPADIDDDDDSDEEVGDDGDGDEGDSEGSNGLDEV